MSDQLGQNDPSDPPQREPEVIFLIKMIQKHLVFLEKKIDALIEQSQSKGSSFNRKHFSRPRKSRDHANRPDGFNRERRFDKPWRNEDREGFRKKKRYFNTNEHGYPRKDRNEAILQKRQEEKRGT